MHETFFSPDNVNSSVILKDTKRVSWGLMVIYDLSKAELMVLLTTVNILKFRTLCVCKNALTNSADPDQTASSEAVRPGSSLFAIPTIIL